MGRADGSFSPEYDHMLLKVMLDRPYIADVGFGECFVDPLLLIPPDAANRDAEYTVKPADGAWELIRKKSDGTVAVQYRFTETSREMNEFADMCRYHQTSPESHFTQNRVCSLALPDGRVTVSGMRVIETHESVREERTLSDYAELRDTLRERFSVEFDAPVDWSRLAR